MVIILSYYFILLVSCVIILYFLSISIWHSLIILLLRSPNFGINHNSEVVSHNFMYKYYYHSSYSEHFIYFLLFLTDMLFHSFHIHLNTAIVFLLFFLSVEELSVSAECWLWFLNQTVISVLFLIRGQRSTPHQTRDQSNSMWHHQRFKQEKERT